MGLRPVSYTHLDVYKRQVEGLAKKTGNARFAYDCYRRFVQMFADVVMMVPKSLFEVEIDKMKEAKGVKNDVDLTADDLKELVGTFKKIYEENEGRPFPQDQMCIRDRRTAGHGLRAADRTARQGRALQSWPRSSDIPVWP